MFLSKTLYSHNVSLHQVYKWVLTKLRLGLTLRWKRIQSRGEYKYSWSLHVTETGIISAASLWATWLVSRLYYLIQSNLRFRLPLESDYLSSATSFPKYQKSPSQMFGTSCKRPPLASDHDSLSQISFVINLP